MTLRPPEISIASHWSWDTGCVTSCLHMNGLRDVTCCTGSAVLFPTLNATEHAALFRFGGALTERPLGPHTWVANT